MTIEERNAIVTRFMPVAESVARKFTMPGADLEDLKSQCYVRLIELVDKMGENLIEPILRTALRRHLLDQKKHNTYLKVDSLDAPLPSDDGENPQTLADKIADPSPSPEDLMIQTDLVTKVTRVIERMPALQQLIVRLHLGLDGSAPLSLRKIAAARDITPDRAKRSFNAAIDKLISEVA